MLLSTFQNCVMEEIWSGRPRGRLLLSSSGVQRYGQCACLRRRQSLSYATV